MSKTAMRVSKTVKRVMRVIMIGLVAMLGAKAEAHYLIIKGKLRFCDLCLALDLRDVEDPFTAVVGSEATNVSLELLCPNPTHVEFRDLGTLGVGVQETLTIMKNGKAEVVLRFALDPALTPPCTGGSPPNDVIIREADVFAEVCVPNAMFGTCDVVSTFTATDCELPAAFNFDNLPPEGTRYECVPPVVTDHLL